MQLLIADIFGGLFVGFVGQQVSHAGLRNKRGFSLVMCYRFSLLNFSPEFLNSNLNRNAIHSYRVL